MVRFYHSRILLKQQGPLLGLIFFIGFIFFLQVILGRETYEPFMLVPAEVVAAWHAFLSGDFSKDVLWELGTMLSTAFLHGDVGHYSGNMLFLWVFAALAAELVGQKWMFATFVFTAICGSICHTALNASEYTPVLGASGAVAGFEGLYLGMAVRWHLPDPHVWPMSSPIPPPQLAAIGIIGLVFDYMGFLGGQTQVAYGAHLGGFIGGMVLGAAIVPMPRLARRR